MLSVGEADHEGAVHKRKLQHISRTGFALEDSLRNGRLADALNRSTHGSGAMGRLKAAIADQVLQDASIYLVGDLCLLSEAGRGFQDEESRNLSDIRTF